MMRHLNLLPPQRRAELAYAQLLQSLLAVVRTAVVGLLLLTLTGAGVGIGLSIMLAYASSDAALAVEEQVRHYRTVRDTIDQHNLLLMELNQLDAERIFWSRVVAGIIVNLPAGVTIDGVTIDAPALLLNVSGTAPDRGAVVNLENRLRSLPWIAAATGPRDNLIERFNPQFQFELRLNAAEAAAL